MTGSAELKWMYTVLAGSTGGVAGLLPARHSYFLLRTCSQHLAQQASEMPRHLQVAWLTPSELFTPYYGAAVASFLLAEHARMRATGAPLRIIEVHNT